jgi:molybdenum cofactor cytidylyltransferase
VSVTPTVIVLAAGKGERFKASGGIHDKLETLLCGQRVRDHVLAAVRASGLPYHVVERAHTAHLANPGMGDSIASGVAATPQAQGWLILPADLPLIQASSLLAVAKALQQHPVVVPCYQGQKGHPVGFQAACGPALMHLRGDQGARAVVAANAFVQLALDDEGVVLDVDTVELQDLAKSRITKR